MPNGRSMSVYTLLGHVVERSTKGSKAGVAEACRRNQLLEGGEVAVAAVRQQATHDCPMLRVAAPHHTSRKDPQPAAAKHHPGHVPTMRNSHYDTETQTDTQGTINNNPTHRTRRMVCKPPKNDLPNLSKFPTRRRSGYRRPWQCDMADLRSAII